MSQNRTFWFVWLVAGSLCCCLALGCAPTTPSQPSSPTTAKDTSAAKDPGTTQAPIATDEPHTPFLPARPVSGPCGITSSHSYGGASAHDKRKIMECMVMPTMLKLFMRYDQKYAAPGAFHCQTCHGESADPANFDFSKPGHLYPLDPYNLPTVDDKDPKIAAAVAFMKYEVVPAMKKITGLDVTCFSCHASTAKKP